MDIIWTPAAAKTALKSDRERGKLVPYSLQVTRIFFSLVGIKRVATTGEYILGLRPAVTIRVLEPRGSNLNAGPVQNLDLKVLASGH